jgi:hypothetical protein
MSTVANKMVQAAAGNSGDILDTLLMGTYFGGKDIIVLDVSDISNISDIGSADNIGNAFLGPPTAIDLTNNLLFLPHSSGSPYNTDTYDISNLSNIYRADVFYSARQAEHGAIADPNREILYSTGKGSYYQIDKLDYSTPSALSRLTYASSSNYLNLYFPELSSDGDTLFTIGSSGNGTGLIKSWDVSGTAFSSLDYLSHSGNPGGNYSGLNWIEQDNYLISGNSHGYIKSFDVSDTSNLALEDTLNVTSSVSGANFTTRHTRAVDSVNNLYFLTDFYCKVYIIDVSDPANLVYKNSIATHVSSGSSAGFVTVDPARKLAFCSFQSGGHLTKAYLYVIDYSDINNLSLTTIDLETINSDFAPNSALYSVGGGQFGYLFKGQ